jgi:hypothetical protein
VLSSRVHFSTILRSQKKWCRSGSDRIRNFKQIPHTDPEKSIPDTQHCPADVNLCTRHNRYSDETWRLIFQHIFFILAICDSPPTLPPGAPGTAFLCNTCGTAFQTLTNYHQHAGLHRRSAAETRRGGGGPLACASRWGDGYLNHRHRVRRRGGSVRVQRLCVDLIEELVQGLCPAATG